MVCFLIWAVRWMISPERNFTRKVSLGFLVWRRMHPSAGTTWQLLHIIILSCSRDPVIYERKSCKKLLVCLASNGLARLEIIVVQRYAENLKKVALLWRHGRHPVIGGNGRNSVQTERGWSFDKAHDGEQVWLQWLSETVQDGFWHGWWNDQRHQDASRYTFGFGLREDWAFLTELQQLICHTQESISGEVINSPFFSGAQSLPLARFLYVGRTRSIERPVSYSILLAEGYGIFKKLKGPCWLVSHYDCTW